MILVILNSTNLLAEDNIFFPTFKPATNSISSFDSFESINYSFERNSFKMYKESNDTRLYESLSYVSLFDNINEYNFNISSNPNEKLNFFWQNSPLFSVHFNIFENQYIDTNAELQDSILKSKQLILSKGFSLSNIDSINRNITGYKIGLSSELGLGNNFMLDLNFDIGQLDGADLIGFNNKEINTTSFALGIRKSNFGASINTDIFLEDLEANLEQSRLGFEIDWHFSNDGKLSFGSKKTMGDTKSYQSNSIDDITGDVQYIKFQHNL
jgi:hypothetical protein